MGLLDKLKVKINRRSRTTSNPIIFHHIYEPTADAPTNFDLAGFDPDHDEDGFFHAVMQMECEGQFGGTAESREEIRRRFRIRDEDHWQLVKDSVYAVLLGKHETMEEVSYREMNWRAAEMQRQLRNLIEKRAVGMRD